jgi:hypothetical protein
MIIETTNTQSLWDDIKSKVNLEANDNIPFMLMPVRLETKFMKHNKRVYDIVVQDEIRRINENVLNIKDKTNLYITYPFENVPQIFSALDEIHSNVSTEESSISKMTTISKSEKEIIYESISLLGSELTTLKTTIPQAFDLSQSSLQTFDNKLAAINSKTNVIKSSLDTISGTTGYSGVAGIYHYELKHELWIRIYPDDIFIHSHEDLLTQDEEVAGVAYWNQWWNSEGNTEVLLAAWRALCELFDSERAAWIIKQTRPTNLPQIEETEITVDPNAPLYSAGIWLQNFGTIKGNQHLAYIEKGNHLIASLTGLHSKINGLSNLINTQETIALLDDLQFQIQSFNQKATEFEAATVTYELEDVLEIDPTSVLENVGKSLLSFRKLDNFPGIETITTTLSEGILEIDSINTELENGRINESLIKPSLKLLGRFKKESHLSKKLIEAIISGSLPYVEEGYVDEDYVKMSNPEFFDTIKTRNDGNEELVLSLIEELDTKFELLRSNIQVRVSELQILYYLEHKNDISGVFTSITTQLNALDSTIKANLANSTSPENIFDNLPVSPVFPTLENKENSWSQAAKSFVLPDRFVAIGLDVAVTSGEEAYTFKQLEVGSLIPSELHVGPDPQSIDSAFSQLASGDIKVDDKIKWMFDFREAVRKGMGIVMELEFPFTEGQTENVFDKLLVLGLKLNKERFIEPIIGKDYSAVNLAEHSKDLIEQLFNNHHYNGNGMSLLKIGTPTNNTDQSDSGFWFDDESYEDSFKVETQGNLFQVTNSSLDKTDGQRLAESLGLDYDIFQNISNSNNKDVSEAKMFNRMLWNGTIGYYMQELFSGMFTRESVTKTKEFFTKYVTARGVIPPVRIGSQPYGILPTTAFSKWEFGYEADLSNFFGSNNVSYDDLWSNEFIADQNFHVRLKSLFDILNKEWYKLAHEKVLRIDKPLDAGETAQQRFIKMLGLHATSTEFFSRYAFNSSELYLWDESYENLEDQLQATSLLSNFPGSLFTNFINEGYYYEGTSGYGFGSSLYIASLYYAEMSSKLKGKITDNLNLSEERILEQSVNNYVNWLSKNNTTLSAIRNNTYHPSEESKPLLYQLLRQSTLLTYLDSLTNIFVKSEIWDRQWYHHLSNGYEYFGAGEFGYKRSFNSKWGKLFGNINTFNDTFFPQAFNTLNDFILANSSLCINLNPNTTLAQEMKLSNSNFWKFYGGLENKQIINDLNAMYQRSKNLPTAKFERLFKEHLDLASYRFDAWQNGLVHERLYNQRNIEGTRNKGIYIGAYAWLENIKPGGVRTQVNTQNTVPPSLQNTDPFYTDADNQGFIHAPSMNHALTAAILRSGYLSNQNDITTKNKLAVNLSSERIRMALHLWEGVRNGQSVAALLGYQFERGLHERFSNLGLDSFIYKFRYKFPLDEDLSSTLNVANPNAQESIPAQNVVNGVDLLAKIREILHTEILNNLDKSLYEIIYLNSNYDLVRVGIKDIHDVEILPANKNDDEAKAIIREIDLMANAIDSLADLAIAEGVFQVTRGNYTRAASTIEAISDGSNLGDIEFINTPRTGYTISHKVAINLEKVTAANMVVNNPWSSIPLTPRAKLEPTLNKWIAKFLPPPNKILCKVLYVNESLDPIEDFISIEDLELQAIDLLYLMSSDIDNGGEELLSRITFFIRTNSVNYFTSLDVGVPSNIQISIITKERSGSWDNSYYTLFELAPIFRDIFEIISKSRSLNAQDLILPENVSNEVPNSQGFDLNELESRIIYLRNEIENLISNINELSNPTLLDLRNYLKLTSDFGANYSIPDSGIDEDNGGETLIFDSLMTRLLSAKDNLNIKINSIDEVFSQILTPVSISTKKNKLLECGEIIFGKSFKMLVHFILSAEDLNEVQDSISQKQDIILRNITNDDISKWFYGLARLRKKLASFETLCSFGDETIELKPIQLPFKETNGVDDYWLGWEYPSSYEPSGSKTSIMFTNQTLITNSTLSEPLVALLLDEWTEFIPNKEETSGITFNYDQPNSKPPQNILLAVSPNINDGKWEWDDLVFTLLETLKSAKIRAVEPDHLNTHEVLGHFLPAVMTMAEVPFNTNVEGTFNNEEETDIKTYFSYNDNNV